MSRALRWAVTVAVLVLAGGVLGGWFGTLMVRFSYDYIVDPRSFADLGVRLGFVAGTVLGAAQVVGPRPLPGWGRLAAAVLVVGAVSCLAILIGKEGSAFLYARGALDTSGWIMPNPWRHAEVVGIEAAVRVGPLVGSLLGAALLWRSRRSTASPSPSPSTRPEETWT